MHSLKVVAQTMGKTVTEIMEPHKDVLQDMIPPKKHLLRHQPANAQIGLMVIIMYSCLGEGRSSIPRWHTNVCY